MSEIETGGPAFPTSADNGHSANQDGMTLRDWFAGKALCGIEASQGNCGAFVSTMEKVAERAYQLADAMLQARQQAGRVNE